MFDFGLPRVLLEDDPATSLLLPDSCPKTTTLKNNKDKCRIVFLFLNEIPEFPERSKAAEDGKVEVDGIPRSFDPEFQSAGT